MESEVITAAQSGIEFTAWGLFSRATPTVKIVIVLLLLSSFWSWSIILQKSIVFGAARREVKRFNRLFWSGAPLDRLFEQIGPNPDGGARQVFAAGMTEWRRSLREDGDMIAGAQARIDRTMDMTIAKCSERLQKGLPVLATIGSTAPFVGLFGTVWGIMRSFTEIAEQQNTNLTVVAPGIAEALLATGLGLLAAIPAVVFFNKLSADSDRIVASYEAFADEFGTIMSRELDR